MSSVSPPPFPWYALKLDTGTSMQSIKSSLHDHSRTAQNPNAGFSLIEVLIALLVLSIGLLGLAMLQIQGFRFIGNSYQRTQATIVATDIIDRLRANKEGADAGAYCLTTAAPASPCNTLADPGNNGCGASAGGCTTLQDLAAYDIHQWYLQQAKYLPSSATPSSITRTAVAGTSIFEYTITIRWMERDLAMSQEWRVQL